MTSLGVASVSSGRESSISSQAVIDVNLVPRLLLTEDQRDLWTKGLAKVLNLRKRIGGLAGGVEDPRALRRNGQAVTVGIDQNWFADHEHTLPERQGYNGAIPSV